MLTTSLFYNYFFNLTLQKCAINISQNFLRRESFHELPCTTFFLLHGFEINLYLRKSCDTCKHLFKSDNSLWCWPLSLPSRLTLTMLSIRQKRRTRDTFKTVNGPSRSALGNEKYLKTEMQVHYMTSNCNQDKQITYPSKYSTRLLTARIF